MLFWVITLAIACVLELVAIGVGGWFLYKFASVIMILEDDFSDAIDAMADVEKGLEKILSMQLFFDSKEVKMVVQEALTEVKSSRIVVNRLIAKFVERSKQKYEVIMEEEPYEELKERMMRDRLNNREGDLMGGPGSGSDQGFSR